MKPYHPESLPLANLDQGKLITLVSEASAALATYNGLLQAMINPAVMLSPLTNQEAVLSSRIEGTQATVEEVLEHEAGQKYEGQKEQDIQEILNYRKAMVLAREWLAEGRQVTLGLIRTLHHLLMDSVRGQGKEPGQFRKEQNWIGPPGCAIEQATFIPPSPLQLLDHLQALEVYLNFNDFDPLSQTAIVHAQFELLHPFKDGNGRIGRLLIPLFLYSKKRLSEPMFYLSSYLEAHREEYYARLKAISTERDWTGWIAFFLNAIIHQARGNHNRVSIIMALHEEMKHQIREITHSQHSAQIVDALFDRPIFRTSDFIERTGIPKPSAHPLIRQLLQAGILTTLRKQAGRKPATLAFPRLINAAEGRDVLPNS
ncbi:Fic family protein [Nitrosococcus wardiae]|uniref:Protein adenylyltransferase n=1 Tax=Nitrosococcus wardiae TaxID=1814290 RepID=A0A4P7BXS1_9GAMM|nr:Fic/DOC family N-terminal domain-containing protein [Nitrosococcus wardiae]QBQ54953.1 Fic family protein [Nitrosococcus wardiae]